MPAVVARCRRSNSPNVRRLADTRASTRTRSAAAWAAVVAPDSSLERARTAAGPICSTKGGMGMG